jgi:hypothetical protein
MNVRRIPAGVLALALTGGAVIGAAVLSGAPAGAAAPRHALVGTFKLTPGACGATSVSGSYFRMIFPKGTVAAGPFFQNPDSLCTTKTYTLAVPGSSGGLTTGRYQPNPVPAFNAQGGALAASIVEPQSFTAIAFSIATNKTDPQTDETVPPPAIWVASGKLTGQVEAWSASWNKLYFNQGSPKPGGGHPGLTLPVSGTYNSATHAFVLTWSSQVVGGPFNGFTGYWHLSGTFVPRSR